MQEIKKPHHMVRLFLFTLRDKLLLLCFVRKCNVTFVSTFTSVLCCTYFSDLDDIELFTKLCEINLIFCNASNILASTCFFESCFSVCCGYVSEIKLYFLEESTISFWIRGNRGNLF